MYKVVAGDTFELISRKVYGTENYTGLLKKANPGVQEPLIIGTTITTPSLPTQTRLRNVASTQFADEVVLYINGQRFRFWTQITLTRSYDSISTIDFVSPWDGTAQDLRQAFKPFQYPQIRLEIGGELMFVGFAITPQPSLTADGKTITISCYSKPGVLSDCTPTLAGDQLEFKEVGLPEIAASLCAPFSIPVQFSAGAGSSFEQVACNPENKILSFLTTLAQQQNMVIGDTPEGRLEFKRFTAGPTVGALRQGLSPLISAQPIFNAQQFYSHVTGIGLGDVGEDTTRYTLANIGAPSFRPLTFTAQDVDAGELVDAVQAKVGRMYADAIVYSVEVATWRTQQGDLWEPGQVVTLNAPDAFVYSDYDFMIKDVIMTRTDTSKTATLTLVLPQAYAGQIPERRPWD